MHALAPHCSRSSQGTQSRDLPPDINLHFSSKLNTGVVEKYRNKWSLMSKNEKYSESIPRMQLMWIGCLWSCLHQMLCIGIFQNMGHLGHFQDSNSQSSLLSDSQQYKWLQFVQFICWVLNPWVNYTSTLKHFIHKRMKCFHKDFSADLSLILSTFLLLASIFLGVWCLHKLLLW